MAKKLMHLKYTAPSGQEFWFEVLEDPCHLPDWEAHGIVIEPLAFTAPEWIPHWLVKPWALAQDLFNFRNPWSADS